MRFPASQLLSTVRLQMAGHKCHTSRMLVTVSSIGKLLGQRHMHHDRHVVRCTCHLSRMRCIPSPRIGGLGQSDCPGFAKVFRDVEVINAHFPGEVASQAVAVSTGARRRLPRNVEDSRASSCAPGTQLKSPPSTTLRPLTASPMRFA